MIFVINKIYIYLFLLIFFTKRLLINIFSGNNFLNNTQTFEYLNFNFFELFLFNHTIPNGHLLLEKVLSIFSLNFNEVFYILNLLYSMFFCFFLNDILKKLSNKRIIRFYILILVSTCLLTYETWRVNHHDHINLFIFSYLFWAIFNFILYNKNFNHIIISLVLLNLFYTLAFVISLLIFFFLIIGNLLNVLKTQKVHYIKIFSVFILIFIIFSKNYISNSNFGPTSMGGANLIQRTIHAIGENKYKKLIEYREEIFPAWWVSITNEILSKNKEIDLVDTRIANLAHGRLDNEILRNFELQKIIIKKNSFLDDEIWKIIKNDELIIKNNFSFYSYGYKQNLISTYYQSFGKSIFLEACKIYPKDLLVGKIGNKGIFLTILQMSSTGGLLPNYYEKNLKYSNNLINNFNNILRLIIIIILIITPLILIKFIKYRKINKKDFFYLVILLSLLSGIITTSTITCCENPRMLVMQFFIIILLCSMNLNYLSEYMKNKIK
jgi:hypothetical protein